MKNYEIIVVGNSAAGVSALKTIRTLNKNISVALVERDTIPAYSRVLTPYYIGGETPRENLFLTTMNFYRENNIEAYFGESLIEINPDKHTITTSGGLTLQFGKLLIATGAEAKKPSIEHKRVLTLRHIEDADKIKSTLKDARTIVGFGGGLVTIPTMSHFSGEIEKHIVISSGRVFSRIVDSEASSVLEAYFSSAGIRVHKRDNIVAVKDEQPNRIKILLESGKQITSDGLLIGKGVNPNISPAKASGIETNWGIVINERCMTSAYNIFAAGDVAEGRDLISGEYTVQGNWITAVEQGIVAAKNMMGINVMYEGSIKNNTTEVFGIDVAVVGYNKDDAPKAVSFSRTERHYYRKVFLDEKDRIIGATLIGETNDAGIYYGMVARRERFSNLRYINQFANQAKVLNSIRMGVMS